MGHTATTIYAPNIDVVGDVAYVLGRQTGDVGHLCGDTDVVVNGVVVDPGGKINKWSLYKPVRHPSVGILNETMRKSVNYGYAPNSYSLLSSAVTAWQNGTLWDYLKPRGLNGGGTGNHEWYRVLDFDGYEANAVCPFEVTYNNEPTIGSSAQYNCSFVADIVDWEEWNSYGPSYTTLYLCLVKTGGTQGTQIYPISSSTTNSFIDIIGGSDKMNYQVSPDAFTPGTTYTIFPCFTTYDAGSSVRTWMNLNESGGSLATWWPLPAPSSSIVPKSSATPSDLTTTTLIDFDFVSYDQVYATSTVKDVQYYIGNGNTGSLTGVTVQAYVYQSGSRLNLASATTIGSISGGSYASGTIAISSTTYTNNTPLQAKVYLEVIATYSGSSFTKTTSLTKNAEKD